MQRKVLRIRKRLAVAAEASHLALKAHEIGKQHHVTGIDFETERVTHSVLEFVYDSVAGGFNAQRAAYLHDVIAGDASAPHAARRHDLSEATALHISANRLARN